MRRCRRSWTPSKTRERRRTDLKARLEHLEGLERAAGTWDRTTFAESLRGSLADWRGFSRGNPVQARQILRKPLVGRLTLSPTVREDGRFYEIAGKVSYGRLLTGIIGVQGLVPPEESGDSDAVQVRGIARPAAWVSQGLAASRYCRSAAATTACQKEAVTLRCSMSHRRSPNLPAK